MGKQQRRQTKRERKMEAKQRRLEELRRARRRQRNRRIGTVILGVAILIGIVGLFRLTGQDRREMLAELNALATDAGCTTAQELASEGAQHHQVGTEIAYRRIPPDSGDHFPSVTQTGIHATPQPEGFFVHNMEHGHVIIHHNGIDEELRFALEDVVRDDPDWTMMHPYPQMEHQLAFTSWTRRMTCDEPTIDAVRAAELFRDVFKDDAPESLAGPRGDLESPEDFPEAPDLPPVEPDPNGDFAPGEPGDEGEGGGEPEGEGDEGEGEDADVGDGASEDGEP